MTAVTGLAEDCSTRQKCDFMTTGIVLCCGSGVMAMYVWLISEFLWTVTKIIWFFVEISPSCLLLFPPLIRLPVDHTVASLVSGCCCCYVEEAIASALLLHTQWRIPCMLVFIMENFRCFDYCDHLRFIFIIKAVQEPAVGMLNDMSN